MRSTSYRHRISGLAAIGGVLLLVAACSSAGASTAPSAAAVPSSAPSAARRSRSGGAGAAIAIAMATGTVGDYLTGADGKTLYVFTADSANTSTCTGTCAQTWPPLVVTGQCTAPPAPA